MRHIQGWFILVIGLGLITVALQGVLRGWLPNGPKGFKHGEGVSRERQPVGFWLFFILYLAAGLCGTAHALRLLLGPSAP